MTSIPPSGDNPNHEPASHYDDAAYYDHAYKRRKADVLFYTEIAREVGGPILELGVGTGRVALAIAKTGTDILGIDPSRPMLERARIRSEKLPIKVRKNIAFAEDDIRTVRLERRFPLIISPFNVWMHLYTRQDVEAACETVLQHLEPGGTFVFDVLNPWPADLARDPTRIYKGRRFKHPETKQFHDYAEAFQYDGVQQVQHIYMFAQPDGAPEKAWTMKVPHRQFFPEELLNLLYYNGIEVVQRYGDFSRSPFTEESDSQVLVCRAKNSLL